MQRNAAMLLGVIGIAGLLGGCATEGPTEATVDPASYPATFQAARKVLRDSRFELERVDSQAGVITTARKHSAGLGTPWDSEQSTAGQEFEDLAQNQRRMVRVTFEPQGVGSDTTGVDVGALGSPLLMRVRVVMYRDYRPGWRVDTGSIRLSSHTVDPELVQRGMEPDFETAISEDRELAARLVKRIADEAGKAAN